MQKSKINIFEYTDYRLYLSDAQKSMKALDPNFSHRFIQLKIRASSSGWFSDVIRGRINLTPKNQFSLSRLFSHSPQEEDYFKELLLFAQSATFEERATHLQKMATFKGVKADIVGRDRFEYYSKWYYAALRELLVSGHPN